MDCLRLVPNNLGFGGLTKFTTDEHTSPEAKKHAQSVLDRVASEEGKHEHRVMGGYKATLKSKS